MRRFCILIFYLSAISFVNSKKIIKSLSQPPYSVEVEISWDHRTDISNCNNFNNDPCSSSDCHNVIDCRTPCIDHHRETFDYDVQVPISVPRIIPVKTSKKVLARTEIKYVSAESDTETICPVNYQMSSTSGECTSSIRPICPTSFEWRNNVCVQTLTTCPIDHNSQGDSCVAKIICPTNYILRGNTCIAPTPICKIGWRWNGDICIIERSVCQAGYTLNHEGKCEDEFLSCPPGYKRVPNTKHCTESQPVCPSGYIMTSNNQCTRTTQKCPANSYQQYGRCVRSKFVCPAGSQQEGNSCIVEEINNFTCCVTECVLQPILRASNQQCFSNCCCCC